MEFTQEVIIIRGQKPIVNEKQYEDWTWECPFPNMGGWTMDELISRQVAQHKINALIDEFETIMKEIRERNVDDSVCGLCEYDGAFMSDSGNWCNECPGFERDDCFKLKDQYREEWARAIKNLPSVQPKTATITIGRTKGETTMWYECDACGEPVDWNDCYCRKCGRRLVHG